MKTFENIINIPLLIRRLNLGTKVIRVRPHKMIGQSFKYKKEVSYPPSEFAGLMRANFEKQPMFYGAIFSEDPKDKDIPRMTCLLETSKEVKDDSFIGKKDFTYSLWVNKRPINLFVIPVFDSYSNPPIDFVWYFEMWEKLISDFKLSEEIVNELKELSQKISFIAKNEEEEKECYTYTATFTKALLDAHPEIDGIMYPSVKLLEEGMGINVALRPEVIDTAFELKGSSICRYFKQSKTQQTILNYKTAHIAPNGKLSYKMVGSYFRDLDYINNVNPSHKIKELEFRY